MTAPTRNQVETALSRVIDPEIGRPLTDLGMIKSVEVSTGGTVKVGIWLTVAGCPMRAEITDRVTEEVRSIPGVSEVSVTLDVMSDEQRATMRERLQGPKKTNPFVEVGNTTKVIAIASGKGGVGKSSVTAALAVLLAERGLRVGVVDADIHGHSIPRLLDALDVPASVDGMIVPPRGHGVQVISMLPFKPGGVTQPVAFRGPMLHRALDQFLTDVYWGDLDFLLLDLPPGTGDMAISAAQLLPKSELLIVTTPQPAAAEVAIRAGMMAQQTHQRVVGVVENMSGFPCPHCGEPVDLFGRGGGDVVASTLSRELGAEIQLLARIPLDPRLREGGDSGRPLVLEDPEAPASRALGAIADHLASQPRGLAGKSLGLTPVRT